ncbi:MAG: hypothetical protein KAS01_01430 [Candidatus Pacebacteria bacterium]|nr:hypothetical protein [Candidatus Paceibacterota bacterium]
MNKAVVILPNGTEKEILINGDPTSSYVRMVIEVTNGGKVISPKLKI